MYYCAYNFLDDFKMRFVKATRKFSHFQAVEIPNLSDVRKIDVGYVVVKHGATLKQENSINWLGNTLHSKNIY